MIPLSKKFGLNFICISNFPSLFLSHYIYKPPLFSSANPYTPPFSSHPLSRAQPPASKSGRPHLSLDLAWSVSLSVSRYLLCLRLQKVSDWSVFVSICFELCRSGERLVFWFEIGWIVDFFFALSVLCYRSKLNFGVLCCWRLDLEVFGGFVWIVWFDGLIWFCCV
jgi:hypothetical protein